MKKITVEVFGKLVTLDAERAAKLARDYEANLTALAEQAPERTERSRAGTAAKWAVYQAVR